MESRKPGAGLLIDDRFEIEDVIDPGLSGAATRFRARDRPTGRTVALIVLQASGLGAPGQLRFWHEAQLLAGLHHPGIASYVAHGQTAEGQVYLATEWLPGESLAERLRRAPLTLAETVRLVRRLAEALAILHGHGVVYRDLRPSNVHLPAQQIERALLVPVGLSSTSLAGRTLSQMSGVVSVLCYMAPEQARGEATIGPAADLFALGSVWWECLVGEPPFAGQRIMEVLARILFEAPPSLSMRCSGAPPALEALLGQMLVKSPPMRLADTGALLRALDALTLTPEDEAKVFRTAPRRTLQGPGQALVSVVLAMPRALVGRPQPVSLPPETAPPRETRQAEYKALLAPYGAQVEFLAGGALLAVLPQMGQTPADQAAQAGRAALALAEQLPDGAVALITERNDAEAGKPLGEAVQKAHELLRAVERQGLWAQAGGETWVWSDKLTAGLLDLQFHVRHLAEDAFILEGEREDETRQVLGKKTPFIGREQEMRTLEGAFAACIEGGMAGAVLVLGPSGAGKSRLRKEFVQRRRERAESVEILIGYGDLMRAAGPGRLLGDALLRSCGLHGRGGPVGLEEQRRRLADRVALHVQACDQERVAEFLGELCGVPFPDTANPRLRAARQEPRLMSEQVTAAWVDFLRAESAAHPVLLVLEDLHWGDAATVRLVDVALLELREQPLLVLGFGRPEVKEHFPKLWQARDAQELHLGGLGRKASERLVRELLGGSTETPAETIARIVEQAGGNALFLEELARAAAEGQRQSSPETVLAILQARFLRLDPTEQEVLRAASIFGERFSRNGLRELLGATGPAGASAPVHETPRRETLDRALASLVTREILYTEAPNLRAGEPQYAFRHALLRDAAYDLLGESERHLGHRLAGAYLERTGERAPLTLALHYRHGGQNDKAAAYYAQASQQAIENSDLAGALQLVTDGLACEAAGEVRGLLCSTASCAHFARGELPGAYQRATEAMPLLEKGSRPWYQAAGIVFLLKTLLGPEALREATQNLLDTRPLPGAESAFLGPVRNLFVCCLNMGLWAPASALRERLQAIATTLASEEVLARGTAETAEAWYALMREGDPWRALERRQAALTAYTVVGDRVIATALLGQVLCDQAHLGDFEPLVTRGPEVIAELSRLQDEGTLGSTRAFFALALAETGESQFYPEAESQAREMLRTSPIPFFWDGMAHAALAEVWLGRQALDEAERAARESVTVFTTASPGGSPIGYAALSRVLLRAGRIEEARAAAEEGMVALGAMGGTSFHDLKLYLAAAESRHAAGDETAARAALGMASQLLGERAARIPDPTVRERFLGRMRHHVRVRELARAWGVAAPMNG